MFIKNCLTPLEDLVVLRENTTIDAAMKTMKEHKLLSVPVVNGMNVFSGLLSKNNLFSLWENGEYKGDWEGFEKLTIDKAVQIIPTLKMDDVFENTFPIIVRFPFVPIVDEDNKFLGIVKRSNVSQSLQSAFGMNVPGIRILLGMVETDGQLDKIIDITRQMDIPIITSITFDAGDTYLRRVLLKVPISANKDKLINELDSHGFRILTVHEYY